MKYTAEQIKEAARILSNMTCAPLAVSASRVKEYVDGGKSIDLYGEIESAIRQAAGRKPHAN